MYRTKKGIPMSHRCTPCKRHFSVRLGTTMEDTNLPLWMWLKATHLLLTSRKGVASTEMATMLGTTQSTAWYLDHRIRDAMRQEDLLLDGVVQVDESWVGGKESNKHASKKAKNNGQTWADKKALVFGVRGRNETVIVFPVWSSDHETIINAVKQSVAPGSLLGRQPCLRVSDQARL